MSTLIQKLRLYIPLFVPHDLTQPLLHLLVVDDPRLLDSARLFGMLDEPLATRRFFLTSVSVLPQLEASVHEARPGAIKSSVSSSQRVK